jgi:GT2 family glycosyltransferase
MDAVFLSYTKDESYHQMTARAISTLRENNASIDFNVVVVETNKDSLRLGFDFPGCKVIHPAGDFNYNLYMRAGFEGCSSDLVLMCNNDLIFEPGSIETLRDTMLSNSILSASPYEPNWHKRYYGETPPAEPIEGYDIENHVCGWCICANLEMLRTNDMLDDRFAFWCQDSNYSMSLLAQGIKHFLVPNAFVRHEFSKSHCLLGERHEHMTHGMQTVLREKWHPEADSA